MNENIIDKIYSNLNIMSSSDQKIAKVVLANPQQVIDATISDLAKKAKVSDASVTRFSHNLGLTGFHELKIRLAQTAGEDNSIKAIPKGDLDAALHQIATNKEAEIKATIDAIDPRIFSAVLKLLEKSRVIQISADGDTYPVAEDAIYKFNQIGIFAMSSGGSVETAIAQTMNLTDQDLLLVISNSGESAAMLKQIKIAQQQGMKIISITNRNDSPIALKSDYHLKTAVRQKVLQGEYYFSRVSAFTVIEAIYLILISQDSERVKHIQNHESLISNQKI